MTMSMILVEDEECDVIRFKRAARKAGLKRRVDVCRSAAEALERLSGQADEQRLPQAGYLLVSDLKMPVMRGTELVARLRRELGLCNLPAFILSSSDASSDVEDALASGANGYILKCESEEDYLSMMRWLDECCGEIEQGRCLEEESWFPKDRPPQLIAGPVAYRKVH